MESRAGAHTAENGGSHSLGGDDGWEQNLMWDIPSAPNNGRYCLAERFLGGHTLVAVGVGKRLMVMTKENFGVIHTSEHLESEVLAVSWSGVSSATQLSVGIMGSEEEAGTVYGVVAAGCAESVELTMVEGAGNRDPAPFRFKPLMTIVVPEKGLPRSPRTPLMPSGIEGGNGMDSMHIAVRLQAGLVSVSGIGGSLKVWRISELPPQTYSMKRPPEPVMKKTTPDWTSSTSGVALHSSFSPDSQVLAWVEKGSQDVHLLVLPIHEVHPEAEADVRMEWDNKDEEAELVALEEKLPENMRRDFKWTTLEASVGRARELRRGEWAVNAGGQCVQVAWSKASHFASVPDRTLLVLKEDCSLMVMLCCIGGKDRRKGPVVLAGMCCKFQLPAEHAPYQVWWLRESGNSHDTHENLPRDPGENEIRGAGGSNGTPRHDERMDDGDWWGGLNAGLVDSGVPEWLSGLKPRTPKGGVRKRNNMVAVQPGMPDSDFVVCVGQDGTVLLCLATFHLHRGVMDEEHNHIRIERSMQLQPRPGLDSSAPVVLSSSFALRADSSRGGISRSSSGNKVATPTGIDLITVIESWGGTRRCLVHSEVNFDRGLAMERNQFISHCEGVACVAAHSTRQYVATCTASGEALVWHYEEGAGGGGSHRPPLSCCALLEGSFKSLAWSPSMDRSNGRWDVVLLWGISSDGTRLCAFTIVPPTRIVPVGGGREDEGGRGGATVSPMYTIPLGGGDLSLACHLRVTPMLEGSGLRQDFGGSASSSRHRGGPDIHAMFATPEKQQVMSPVSRERGGEVDAQVVIAVTGARARAWRIEVCADNDGLPRVVDRSVRGEGDADLGEEPWCLASLDQMDTTWAGQSALLVSGCASGLRAWECGGTGSIVDAGHTFDAKGGELKNVTQACLVTAFELFVIASDGTSGEEGSSSRGVMLARDSDRCWREREEIFARDAGVGGGARAASFLCGDGSAIIAIVDVSGVTLVAPHPWSWEEYEGEKTGSGWGKRDAAAVGERFARKWVIIRHVPLTGFPQNAPQPREGFGKPRGVGHVGWGAEGSLFTSMVGAEGSRGRTVMLSAGMYVPPTHIASSGKSKAKQMLMSPMRKALAMSRKGAGGGTALWTKVDGIRGGAGCVYYHPSILRHAVLCGQIDEAERRLKRLLEELREQGDVESYFGEQDSGLDSAAGFGDGFGADADAGGGDAVLGGVGDEEREKKQALDFGAGKWEGVDFGAVRKICGMGMAAASKVKPVSALVAKDPRLAMLFPGGGGPTDGTDWEEVGALIDSIEASRNRNNNSNGSGGGSSGVGGDFGQGGSQGSGRGIGKGKITCEDARELGKQVARAMDAGGTGGLEGVSPEAGRQLLGMISAIASLREGVLAEALDEEALPLFVLGLSASKLPNDGPAGTVPSLAMALAIHSEAQDVILPRAVPTEVGWESFRAPLWVRSTEALREYAERVGREEYQRSKDPWAAALFFVLARKTGALSRLFKANGEDRVADFLNRDFSVEQSKIAARKNAYSLVGKHRHGGAAAFFILGGNIKEAVDLYVLSKDENLDMALLITRLAAASRQEEIQAVKDMVKERLLPSALASNDRGLAHCCYVLLEEYNAALASLWSSEEAKRLSCGKEESQRGGGGAVGGGGLLGKAWGEEGGGGAGGSVDDEVYFDGKVEQCIHPCTWWVIERIRQRPRVLLETRMLPKGCIARPPKRTMLFGAAEAFLADGCAALAGQAVQAVFRLGPMSRGDSMRARAMSICACLARLSDRIKTEGAQHSSTGHNQGALTRVKHLLEEEVDALGLEQSDVRGLLARLCMVRSFWRLQHAITTSHWGGSSDPSTPAGHGQSKLAFSSDPEMAAKNGTGSTGEGYAAGPGGVSMAAVFGRQPSFRSPKASVASGASAVFGGGVNLSSVASHPLTCHMADSIASLIVSLHSRTELPLAIVSRLERKGKFLQLILHSLTLDNEGDTGALAVLAACVMSVHILLLWARRDLKAIHRLMIKDEGFADHDPAAALSWLMQACHPYEFCIGEGHRKEDRRSSSSCLQPGSSPSAGGSWSSFNDASSEGTWDNGGLQEGTSCVLWVVLHSLCWRISRALLTPNDPPSSPFPFSEEERSSVVHGHGDSRKQHHQRVGGGGDGAVSSPMHGAKQVMSWARPRFPSFGLKDKDKSGGTQGGGGGGGGISSSAQPGSPYVYNAGDRGEEPEVVTPSEHAFRKFSAEPFSGREQPLQLGGGGAGRSGSGWQQRAPDEVGGRLLRALTGWSSRMKESLQRDLLRLVVDNAKNSALGVGNSRRESEVKRLGVSEILGDDEAAVELWLHYDVSWHMEELIRDIVKRYEESDSSDVVTLSTSLDVFRQRNARLTALGSPVFYQGSLKIRLVHARNLRLPDSVFGMRNDSKPNSYGVLQYEGGVEKGGKWREQRQASGIVRKESCPNYHHLFEFPILQPCHTLTVAIMEKNNFSEDDTIGSCNIDLDQILMGQMAEFDVPLRREREVVGHTRLRVTFDFRLEQRVEKFKPGSVKKTPLRHSDSMSAVSSISHHAGDSDTFQSSTLPSLGGQDTPSTPKLKLTRAPLSGTPDTSTTFSTPVKGGDAGEAGSEAKPTPKFNLTRKPLPGSPGTFASPGGFGRF